MTILDEEETILDIRWECADYPEDGAYSGEYVFEAVMPDGYILDEFAPALEVAVELGGANRCV